MPGLEKLAPEEIQILRQARIFKELFGSEGWKEYEKLLSTMIQARQQILIQPMHTLNQDALMGSDFVGRAAQMESIKGSVLGLRLALNLPHDIIRAADEIMSKSASENSDAA